MTNQELAQLKKAQEMVVCDLLVMRGTPIFRSTRIPIDLVVDMIAQGATVEEVIEGYPALDREKIELAQLFMRAFPRCAPSSRQPWAKQRPIRITQQPR